MRQRAIITTPFPTIDELAERFGISPKRKQELLDLADRLIDKRSARMRRTEASAKAARKNAGAAKRMKRTRAKNPGQHA